MSLQSCSGGRLPSPGWLGRIYRMVLGLVLLAWLTWGVASFFAQSSGWPLSLLLALPMVVYFLGDVFKIGFGRDWHRKPQFTALSLISLALVADLVLAGRLGAAPSHWVLMVLSGTGLLYGGLAYLLAAAVGSPG